MCLRVCVCVTDLVCVYVSVRGSVVSDFFMYVVVCAIICLLFLRGLFFFFLCFCSLGYEQLYFHVILVCGLVSVCVSMCEYAYVYMCVCVIKI